VYVRRVVKRRPASLTHEEWLQVIERGKLPCPDFRSRDGGAPPRVTVERVLCWWCRTFHSPEEVESCMKIPERRASAQSGGGSSSSALDAGPLAGCSELWAFLQGIDTVTGASRLPGSMSLKLQSGLLALTLNDQETSQYVFLQGRSLGDLLLMVEAGLADGSLPWRESSGDKRKRR